MKFRFAIVLLCVFAPVVFGVVGVPLGVKNAYTQASVVMIAKVAKVDEANFAIDADVIEVVKGEAKANHFQFLLRKPQEMIKKFAAGQPLVMFPGNAGPGMMHLADTWLLITPDKAKPERYFIDGANNQDMVKSFPGHTAALVKIVGEFKANKPTILMKTEDRIFNEPPGELVKVGAKPTAIFSLGNGLVAVSTEKGIEVFSEKEKYANVAEKISLNAASGIIQAVGDSNGDGKSDLLVIGNTIWFGNDEKFTAGPKLDLPAEKELVAVGIIDTNNDKRADVVALKTDGQLIIFENPGAHDKPWAARPPKALWKEDPHPALAAAFGTFGDDSEPCVIVVRASGVYRYSLGESPAASDFTRLTGESFDVHLKKIGKLDKAGAISLDVNGDGRMDFLLTTETGSLLLVNRGFGVFIPVTDSGANTTMPGASEKGLNRPSGALISSADLHADKHADLLILNNEGTLYELNNPPPKAK